MVNAQAYSHLGIKKTSKQLPSVFAAKINLTVLSQAIRVYEANRHPELSRVKTRGEMSISTRKIYRQKGTGNARHGAKSAPIFVGGGIAHGPKGIKRKLRLSKKIAKNTLAMALSLKQKRNEIFLIDGLEKIDKTKQANMLILKLFGEEKPNRVTFVTLPKLEDKTRRVLRNLKNTKYVSYDRLNAYNTFYGGTLFFDSRVFNKENK